VGLVDADRVRQAKERLKEYQKTKNTGKWWEFVTNVVSYTIILFVCTFC
jgi:hypothetical protein